MTRSPLRGPARAAAALGVAATLAVALAACSSSSSTGGSAASGASSSTGVATASADLAKVTAVPSFANTQDDISIASLKGKTIYSIPQNSSIPFLSIADQAEAKIAKANGINFVEYSTQGTPSEWIRGINAAISAKAGAIMLNALDPRLVGPQVAAAKAAGIPVVSSQFFDLSQASMVPSALAGTRSDNFSGAAKLLADWTIKDTAGKADVVVVENTEQLSTQAMLTAMKAEFAADCPSCKVTYINVPSADWATKIQTEVQSALVKDPNVNYVIPIYDPMTQFVVPAITATGKTGKVHIATFNGTPAALKMLETGDVVRMDIGENLDWLAYANLDQAFRAMLGKPTLSDEDTALRVFTKDNVADTGTPPAFNTGFGDSYVTGYQKLWGIG